MDKRKKQNEKFNFNTEKYVTTKKKKKLKKKKLLKEIKLNRWFLFGLAVIQMLIITVYLVDEETAYYNKDIVPFVSQDRLEDMLERDVMFNRKRMYEQQRTGW